MNYLEAVKKLTAKNCMSRKAWMDSLIQHYVAIFPAGVCYRRFYRASTGWAWMHGDLSRPNLLAKDWVVCDGRPDEGRHNRDFAVIADTPIAGGSHADPS